MSRSYTFRLVHVNDFNTLSRWLKTPEVARWYEDSDYIEVLKSHLNDDRIRMQLVHYQGLPIAFVQDYDIHGWAGHHLAYLPKRARGIDTFIGHSELMGKGHGTKYISLLTSQLFIAGAPAIGIDPHPLNVSARKVYQKIGFTEDGEIDSQWGSVVLMSLCLSTEL